MDFKVEIDQKAVEAALTKSILESSIGKHVEEIINKHLDSLRDSYTPGPLRKAIEGEVDVIILKLVETEYKEQIHKAIRKKLTDEMVSEIVDAAWDGILKRRG